MGVSVWGGDEPAVLYFDPHALAWREAGLLKPHSGDTRPGEERGCASPCRVPVKVFGARCTALMDSSLTVAHKGLRGSGAVGHNYPIPAGFADGTMMPATVRVFNKDRTRCAQTRAPKSEPASEPDGSAVTYRPAGQASSKTADDTATVEVNNPAVKAINRGEIAKFKFPGK